MNDRTKHIIQEQEATILLRYRYAKPDVTPISTELLDNDGAFLLDNDDAQLLDNV